jgi:Transposase DDE domain
MGRPRRRDVGPGDIEGLEYFDVLVPLLARLRDVGSQRDRAGNRQLFYDQYVGLLLLYFFSPTITSLRALQQASTLAAVQRRLGIRATSLGSFSEAARLFDAAAMHEILQELAGKALPLVDGPQAQELLHLTAVDGSIFRAFPRMAWALWKNSEERGVRLHLHFDVFCNAPRDAAITHASGSEIAQLRAMLQPNRLYAIDRGYLSYELYRDIIAAGSSFIGRIKDNSAYTVKSPRALAAADQAAGVVSDEVLQRLGASHHKDELKGQDLRLVKVERTSDVGEVEAWWLLTNRLDLPAELVALGYRYRWTVELFFRWLKCVMGCKQLLTTSKNGVALQIYTALIASLVGCAVDRAQTHQANLGDAAVLLSGVGLNRRSRGSSRKTQAHGTEGAQSGRLFNQVLIEFIFAESPLGRPMGRLRCFSLRALRQVCSLDRPPTLRPGATSRPQNP